MPDDVSTGAQVRRRVIYSGHVQGVYFRATAQELARRRALVGFVRNLRDGSVELEVQGPLREVQALLDAIAERYAGHIRQTQVTDVPTRGDETDFEIRY